jgi:hypothetical protein
MTTVLEGLATVLGADERIKEYHRDLSDAKRKLSDAMAHLMELELLLTTNEITLPERPYSISK